MKKISLFVIAFSVFFSVFFVVFAKTSDFSVSNSDIQEAVRQAKSMQVQIENECKKDPYACSCESIPCSDISQIENQRAQEGYERCIQEKNSCELKKQNAMKEVVEKKNKIESDCKKNLNACNCSSIESENGRKQCELAVIEAKYQKEKEKTDKIRSCANNLNACDCSSIKDNEGRLECESKLNEGKVIKEKIEKACKENPMNCDCSQIGHTEGKAQCEEGVKNGLMEVESSVKSALSKCFKDVEKCNCSELGLEEKSYVDFCEIQKSYGLSCKHEGINCEKLEEVEIYPTGMPPWLGKLFSKSYAEYINKEKEKGAKEAAGIITQCLNNAKNCDCGKTPGYARAFCEKKKALQVKCESGDYDACLILDSEPLLPEGVPSFAVGMLEKLVNSLKNTRKQLVISNAARKVGNMILECMEDASRCDCSIAPSGPIKTFCEHKKILVAECRERKIYESCFKLDEESNYPPETPDIIKNYIDRKIIPQINEKKQKIFDQMKKGTICENITTLSECKKVYFSQI